MDTKSEIQREQKNKNPYFIDAPAKVALIVGDITKSNDGRTMSIQKTDRKQTTWRHNIIFLRQYLPPHYCC